MTARWQEKPRASPQHTHRHLKTLHEAQGGCRAACPNRLPASGAMHALTILQYKRRVEPPPSRPPAPVRRARACVASRRDRLFAECGRPRHMRFPCCTVCLPLAPSYIICACRGRARAPGPPSSSLAACSHCTRALAPPTPALTSCRGRAPRPLHARHGQPPLSRTPPLPAALLPVAAICSSGAATNLAVASGSAKPLRPPPWRWNCSGRDWAPAPAGAWPA